MSVLAYAMQAGRLRSQRMRSQRMRSQRMRSQRMRSQRMRSPVSTTMNANELKNVLRPAGWHSRGYLRHYDGGEIPQFVTFRLGDSLPQTVLERWRIELQKETSIDIDAALRRRIEAYLD